MLSLNRRIVFSANTYDGIPWSGADTYDGKPWSKVLNNTPQEIADGVSVIVQQLRKMIPQSKILLLGILPRGVNSKLDQAVGDNNNAANSLFKQIADGNAVCYRDIGEVFLNKDGGIAKELFMPDLIHLNEAGYQKWAEAIEKDVANLLGKRNEQSN